MDNLGFGLFIGGIVMILLVADTYRRGRRAGMAFARRLLEDPFNTATITMHPPTMIMGELPAETLLNRLKLAHSWLSLSGFLTSKESMEIINRICAWDVIASKSSNNGPF